MATLLPKSFQTNIDYSAKDIPAEIKNAEAKVHTFMAELQAKNPGTVIGQEIRFSIADGDAWYIVTAQRGNAITLQHVDFLDGYRAHPATIRGCTAKDVKEYMAFQAVFDNAKSQN